jgi:hypothetical protein
MSSPTVQRPRPSSTGAAVRHRLLAPVPRALLVLAVVAAAVALGPLAGFVPSRGPGLPGYRDDKGIWTEPLGLISLLVEGVLLAIAGLVLARSRRAAR